MALYLKTISEFPLHKDALWVWQYWLYSDVLFPYIFIILLLSSLEEGCGPLFIKIWIPSTQGCFVPNLVEIGPVVLKREFLNIFNIILLFCFYPLSEKGFALHLNKPESPPTKDVLCQVNLVEIGPVVLEKKLFKNFQYNFTFWQLSPLGEGRGP